MTPNDLLEAEDTQSEYDKGFDDIIARNYGKTAPSDTVDNSIGNAEEILGEQNKKPGPDSTDSGWTDNTGKSINTGGNKFKTAVSLAKKRGGLIGLIGLFGVTGGILASLFAPASVLISLMENATLQNDTSSTVMQRRFLKAFGFNTQDADTNLLCKNGSKVACSMGKISNKALYDLNKKGVTAKYNSAPDYDPTIKTGYPAKNPDSWDIDIGDGNVKNVTSNDLPDFLSQKSNSKYAAKFLGHTGAFNLRLKAWTGKHITNRLFAKFPSLDRRGGISDGDTSTTKGRLAAAKKKLLSAIPGFEAVDNIKTRISTKIDSQMGRVRKGGVAYTIAVGGCMVAKAPKIITAGVTAVQLAQILPFAFNTFLSPGSKQKAAYISNMTPQDAENPGVLLTNKTARPSDGKLTSALDSKYLLSAIGVNKNKPPVSSFSPGYSLLSDQRMQSLYKLDDATKSSCDVIMSPAAMYSAAAIDSATTVILSSTVVLGILKVVASFAVSIIVSELISSLVANYGVDIINEIAQNDAIPKAEGEALGDVLGVSAAAFFAVGGAGRHLPTLKRSQLPKYNEILTETQQFEREMDIATLSPFDTSSRHTLLGSIVYNSRMAMFGGGEYNYNLASIVTSLPQLPFRALSSPASATVGINDQYCSYAEDFNYTGEANDLPGVNFAGLPCTGITEEQDGMTTTQAIKYLSEVDGEGWLDDSVEIEDSDSIDKLIEKGYIKKDTPLLDYIQTCGDAYSGDYMFIAAGCTVDTEEPDGDLNSLRDKLDTSCYMVDIDDGGTEEYCPNNDQTNSASVGELEDQKSLAAMSVFLVDYQVIKSVNGEDEGQDTLPSSDSPVVDPSVISGDWKNPAPTYTVYSNPFGAPVSYTSGYIRPDGRDGHNGIDMAGTHKSERLYAACSGTTTTSTRGEYTTANTIVIDCGGGVTTGYHHAVLTAGTNVVAGQDIGYTDRSGVTTGWHLHFTTKVNGAFVNPIDFMRGKGVELFPPAGAV